MLLELHITNLAVIEKASIRLVPGLNCFTGQTGAGKSLVIGAFELMLGLRGAKDMLREHADEGRVVGTFRISNPRIINSINEITGLSLKTDDGPQSLEITRKLFASGRTSISFNGQGGTLSMLRQVGEQLIDVHGQHDHQSLMQPMNQLLTLDRFAETEALRNRFTDVHDRFVELSKRRDRLEQEIEESERLRDQYETVCEQIDDIAPDAEEYTQLTTMVNQAKIKQEVTQCHAALTDADASALDQLHTVTSTLQQLAKLDQGLSPIVDGLYAAREQLGDAIADLSRYTSNLDFLESEFQAAVERLDSLNELVMSYAPQGQRGEEGINAVLEYHAQIRGELSQMRDSRTELTSVEKELAEVSASRTELGEQLSKARRAAAKKLCKQVEAQIKDLGMPSARFGVEFTKLQPEATAAPNEPTGRTGFDRVEMMIQANPGQSAKPMRQVASGGELSRIMLGLKTILAHHDSVNVLVFDEVDANIGGRLGTLIGRKLQLLASHHQTLCITHLPQIAAFAEHHLKVIKTIDDGETRTTLRELEGDERIDELAEMLTGENTSDITRRQAIEMIDLAKPE